MLLKKNRSATLEKCQQHTGQQKSPAKLTILFPQKPLQHGAVQEHHLHDYLIQYVIC